MMPQNRRRFRCRAGTFPAPSVLISKEISRSRCHEDGRAEHEAIHTDGKIADKKEILMHRKSFLRSVKDLDRTKINVIGRDEAVPRAIPDALEEVQEMGSVTVDVAVDTGCDFVVPAELGKACHFFRFVEGG